MPLAEVVLAPTPVQGEEAPLKLVEALQNLNRLVKPDVILLARGGGSIEDLWAFNDERVVRAISGVAGTGHHRGRTRNGFHPGRFCSRPAGTHAHGCSRTGDSHHGAGTEAGTGRDERRSLPEAWRHSSSDSEPCWKDCKADYVFPPHLRKVQTERQRVDEMNRRGNAAQVHRLELADGAPDGI